MFSSLTCFFFMVIHNIQPTHSPFFSRNTYVHLIFPIYEYSSNLSTNKCQSCIFRLKCWTREINKWDFQLVSFRWILVEVMKRSFIKWDLIHFIMHCLVFDNWKKCISFTHFCSYIFFTKPSFSVIFVASVVIKQYSFKKRSI